MKYKTSISNSNKGQYLEGIINRTCKQYLTKGRAVIDKIPTPVRITSNRGGRIKGTLAGKSTVDYTGVVADTGLGVCFEAKQTKQKSLPFQNIHKHQINYMKQFSRTGAKAFIIVYFSTLDEYYRLDIESLAGYIETPTSNKKSIPVSYFKEHGLKLKSEHGYFLHFLKGLGVE